MLHKHKTWGMRMKWLAVKVSMSGRGNRSGHTRAHLMRCACVSVWCCDGTERPEPRSRRMVVFDVGDLGECVWLLVVESAVNAGKGRRHVGMGGVANFARCPPRRSAVIRCQQSETPMPAGVACVAKKRAVGRRCTKTELELLLRAQANGSALALSLS